MAALAGVLRLNPRAPAAAAAAAAALRRSRPLAPRSQPRWLSAGPTLSAGPPGAVEQAAAASAPEAVPYIFDVNDADFMQKVATPGHTTPILLDCHAEWCGPCKALTPMLEEVVRSYGGRVLLAKMDVDASPQVAAQMQIKQIPLIAGFKHMKMPDGNEGMSVAGSIQGAPEDREALVKFIEETLGVEAPAASPEEQVAAAMLALEEGEATEAMQLFNAALSEASKLEQLDVQAEATAGMLRCYMALADTEPQAKVAAEMVSKALREDPLKAYSSRPAVAQALASYMLFDDPDADSDESPADVAALAATGDLTAKLKMAKMLFAKGDQQQAVSEALGVLKEDPAHDEEAAKKLLLQFFEVLGGDNPIAAKARRRMANMLFV